MGQWVSKNIVCTWDMGHGIQAVDFKQIGVEKTKRVIMLCSLLETTWVKADLLMVICTLLESIVLVGV